VSAQLVNLTGQMTVPVVQILTACPTLTVMGYGLLSTAGVSWAPTGGIVTAERSDVSARLRATSKTFLFMFSLLRAWDFTAPLLDEPHYHTDN
jgi:hypothetical protein